MSVKRSLVKYFCGRIYLGADDVEGWLGSGAGWVRDEIEAATRLDAREKGKKKYTLAINTNIDPDRWAAGGRVNGSDVTVLHKIRNLLHCISSMHTADRNFAEAVG